ncbi:NAD(+)/NADH kinase [bacterium]|nr:NAD(+)/NADH kinase [bacterium]
MSQKTIGLVARIGVPEVVPYAQQIVEWCRREGHDVVGSPATEEFCGLSCDRTVEEYEIASVADPIVTLGGDGTLIGVARQARENTPVLLGVNFGTLGFLTEIAPEEALSVLQAVVAGDAALARREMLLAEVIRDGEVKFSCQAVNEALVQKGTRDRLLTLDVTADEQRVIELKGDGIIVSTPTGSTAYSLAAGGSIVAPSLSVVLLSPVCPHSLTARPLILSGDTTIAVKVPEDYEGEVFLLVDGQESFELHPRDAVKVSRSPHAVTFVPSSTKSYFDILRTKLRWGQRNDER